MISLDGITVSQLIGFLQQLPQDYPVSFFGDNAPALVLDKENGGVMIDNEKWFEEQENMA